MSMYGHDPRQQPPYEERNAPWPTWLWALLVGGPVGALMLVAGIVALTSPRSPATTSSPPPRSHESSPFAHADVECSTVLGSAHCTVTMKGGAGKVCWNVVVKCDGVDRVANNCSDRLESGERASYTIPNAWFAPDWTDEMTCTSSRITNVEMK